jgi:hypothetical protein
MFDKIKNLFKKKEENNPRPKDDMEPWVNVVKTNIDTSDPKQGFMELEWNVGFVNFLISHGYTGNSHEEVVDAWFTDLCRSIGQQVDEESKFVANADLLPKKRAKKSVDKNKE